MGILTVCPQLAQTSQPAREALPRPLRAVGLTDAHTWPLVAWGKGEPSFRVPADRAWRYPLVELSRTGNSYAALGLDLDGRECILAFYDAVYAGKLPWPSFVVERCVSGNLQAHYCLARPVHRSDAARSGPLAFLAWVSEYFVHAAGADPGYVGVLARNPLVSAHRDRRALDGRCRTVWGRREPYSLRELSNVIPLGWRRPSVVLSPIGRNVTLFRTLMRESGKPSNRDLPLMPLALAVADALREFVPADHPFTYSEVCACVSSVERIQRRNHASGQSAANFSRIQASRGRRSGAVRRFGSREAAAPWEGEGVSRATWYRAAACHGALAVPSSFRLERRPLAVSLTSSQPWVAQGISRSTWYRRRCGASPRVTRGAPWESAGVSRATWYRRRAAALAGQVRP